jgi:hypothetical protein
LNNLGLLSQPNIQRAHHREERFLFHIRLQVQQALSKAIVRFECHLEESMKFSEFYPKHTLASVKINKIRMQSQTSDFLLDVREKVMSGRMIRCRTASFRYRWRL